MSKGTKQVRVGRVVKIIEGLEKRIEVFEEMKREKEYETDFFKGMLKGRIAELENTIQILKEEFDIL